MSGREGTSSIRLGTVNEGKFAKFILTQSWEIAEAMVRFMAGPPTTERERFTRNVAAARTNSDWLRPH